MVVRVPLGDVLFLGFLERWQEAVYSVMDKAYFTGMWIVEEIGLARDIRLYSYGEVHSLPWEDLKRHSGDWRRRMMKLDRFPWSRTTIDEADLSQTFKELADTRTEMGRRKNLSLIHISEPTRLLSISYAVLPTLKHIGAFDAHRTVAPDYKQAAARCAEGMKSIGCVLFIPWFQACLARYIFV